MSLTPAQKLYMGLLRTDLFFFARQCFTSLYPGKSFMDNWHIRSVLYHLRLGYEGKVRNLIINLPPRHLKTFLTSVVWPALLLGWDPSTKIFCVSYSEDLAGTIARDFNRIVDSPWYRALFPKTRWVKSTATERVTDQGGFRLALSVGGAITGKGADFIIIDDPAKPDEALSEKQRKWLNDWYSSTLASRLDEKEFGVTILVMQRLHVYDLTGYLCKLGGFTRLSFPAIAMVDETIRISDTETHVRKVGTALQAERESLQVLTAFKQKLPTRVFQSQYQQAPEMPNGGIVKHKYLRFASEPPKLEGECKVFFSVDAASSGSASAHYSSIVVGITKDRVHYVTDAVRGKWDYEMLKTKVVNFHTKFPDAYFIIENASAGISLLRAVTELHYNRFSAEASVDKTMRLARILPVFDQRRVVFVKNPGNVVRIDSLVTELLLFPDGAYDDQVDSLVHAVTVMERLMRPAD